MPVLNILGSFEPWCEPSCSVTKSMPRGVRAHLILEKKRAIDLEAFDRLWAEESTNVMSKTMTMSEVNAG